MSIRRIFLFLLVAVAFLIATEIPIKSNPGPDDELIVGRNVNMVAGQDPITGDPYLQRQNEPSIAVSTRNPMHLLAAANDYRTVDVPFSEGPLPGIDLKAQAGGDAWLGIFKSYNGGQSWTSTLLPGYPQDLGTASPLHEYSTACDPTVRAGSSGLFFTSGIAFDRIEHGGSAIFVARYIDNNTQAIGDMDSIKYLDVNIITKGTSGQFADKPWIAIDAPKDINDTVPIYAPGGVQNIPRFNVYIVYSIFLGSEQSGGGSKIMFVKSTDCGDSWGDPIKLSESVHVCQGTNIVVSPKDGTIYVAWRQYAREQQGVPHAIVMCKSEDSDRIFAKSTVVTEIDPFDQFTNTDRFRTSAFPALAVDHNGLVYVAWSQRGVGSLNEEARIVIKTSKDGINWSDPTAIDNHDGGGHQIMPSLTYAGGKLIMTWYDTRKSDLHMLPDISGEQQTMDVRVAQADPSDLSSDPPVNPDFGDYSVQVSRYLYQVEADSDGHVIHPPVVYQAQFNFANYPIFMEGAAPFMGDYLDITPAPMFLYDYDDEYGAWRWRFNTGERAFDPTLSYITFACNRDVVPPRVGFTWKDYWPPGSGGEGCDEWTAGMRNQNIYSAPITQGILVGSPVNTKPLAEYRRSFLVFVKNLTDYPKLIRLTIDAPALMDASFWEFETPPDEECPFEFCKEDGRVVEVSIFPHSSITLTVFVQPYIPNSLATFRVNVEEIIDVPGGTPIIGLQSSIVLNPDPENTQLIPPLAVEDHTPFIVTEDPVDVDWGDATMLSAPVVYSPYLEELLNSSNPDIAAPGLRHPGLRHDTIINPGLRHTSIGNIPEGEVTDLRWSVTNASSTTSAYSFEAIAEIPPVPHQLLIYRVTTTPMSAEQCQLSAEEHHELLLTVENPGLRHPGLRHPGLRHPGLRHNTFFLAPGETAICTLRLIDPDPPSESGGSTQEAAILSNGGTQNDFIPEDYATTVAGAAIPQAANSVGIIDFASSLYIIAREAPENPLPTAWVNDPYVDQCPDPPCPVFLEAYGGKYYQIDPGEDLDDPNDDIWKYQYWTEILKNNETQLPPGLSFALDQENNPIISGTPAYGPNVNYPEDYYFTVEVKDESSPQQTARREFKITINCEYHTITPSSGPGGSIAPSGDVTVPHGLDSEEFEIKPDDCFHVVDVIVDKEIHLGPMTTHTFTDVRADHMIHAIFDRDTFTITASAEVGGSIAPDGDQIVDCDDSIKFTVSVDEGYMLEDVVVDKDTLGEFHLGPKTEYTFEFVRADHTIEAVFKELQKWVRRYNNKPVNGNDEANDIAVDLSNNVYVTGYSLSRNKGKDFYTISYDSEGVIGLSARYDGPAHMGDIGNAIAVDAENVCVTGESFRGMKLEHSDYCTVKYNSSRELVWDVRYDARRNGQDVAAAIALDLEGNVYITGRSEYSLSKKSDVLHYDYYTIKYNADNGRIAWYGRYDNTGVENAQDEAVALAVNSSSGNVYVTGKSEGNGTGFDIVTITYDSEGNESRVARYNNVQADGNDEAAAIALDLEGNIYVTGFSSNGANKDIITIKYPSDGTINTDWGTNGVARFDGNYNDEAVAIAVDSAGNVYVSGYSSNGTNNDYVTIMYDTSGNEMWAVRYDNNGNDEAVDIAIDTAGNIYVTGRSQGSGTDFDYYTIKYDNHLGNMVWRVRYDNSGVDEAVAIAVFEDPLSGYVHVYVTGSSQGNATGLDFATIKYEQ